ncbi:MAG: polysaccharide deacetylase family protein [Treponema sp.]|nr:polysaccharide deacetylase family protein [Treponema sp.]
MKKFFFYILVLLPGLFFSCKTSPPAESVPPPGLSSAEEEGGAAAAAVPEIVSAMARIVRKVQSRDVPVYYTLDENSAIVVKSDLVDDEGKNEELFEVIYDLKNAAPVEDFRYRIPFSVENRAGGLKENHELDWNIEEGRSGLLLSFDDHFTGVWAENFERFGSHGARVTFFITGTWHEFCAEALRQGHDVQYHSLGHLNLTKVSRGVFFRETLAALDSFRNKGLRFDAFAYPFGLREDWMNDALYPYFEILRGYGVTFRLYPLEDLGRGYHASAAIDNIIYKDDEDFKAHITLMLRTLKFVSGNQALPLTTHTISDEALWGIKPWRLDYLLESAAGLRLRYYTYSDLKAMSPDRASSTPVKSTP